MPTHTTSYFCLNYALFPTLSLLSRFLQCEGPQRTRTLEKLSTQCTKYTTHKSQQILHEIKGSQRADTGWNTIWSSNPQNTSTEYSWFHKSCLWSSEHDQSSLSTKPFVVSIDVSLPPSWLCETHWRSFEKPLSSKHPLNTSRRWLICVGKHGRMTLSAW